MLFAGDVYFFDHVLNTYDSGGGIGGILDEGIRAEIEAADIFMVNQEFPFTIRGTKVEDKQFTFRVPQSCLHILKEMGVDIVILANNHILDFGPEDHRFFGYLTGVYGCFLGSGKGPSGSISLYDTTLPLNAIEEARDACDYLAVYVHWGVEREDTPKDY